MIKNLCKYRCLVKRLAVSDFNVRYKNSVLGFFWSLLEPLLMLMVLYIIFVDFFPSTQKNYPLFLLLGIVLWDFFPKVTSMDLSSLDLEALNTYYRDIQYIWAVILQAGFFASGIFIDFSTYQGELKNLLLLNPMARIILISRESLLYNTVVSSSDLICCFASSIVMLIIGYLIFINLEPGFAEEV